MLTKNVESTYKSRKKIRTIQFLFAGLSQNHGFSSERAILGSITDIIKWSSMAIIHIHIAYILALSLTLLRHKFRNAHTKRTTITLTHPQPCSHAHHQTRARTPFAILADIKNTRIDNYPFHQVCGLPREYSNRSSRICGLSIASNIQLVILDGRPAN